MGCRPFLHLVSMISLSASHLLYLQYEFCNTHFKGNRFLWIPYFIFIIITIERWATVSLKIHPHSRMVSPACFTISCLIWMHHLLPCICCVPDMVCAKLQVSLIKLILKPSCCTWFYFCVLEWKDSIKIHTKGFIILFVKKKKKLENRVLSFLLLSLY